LGSAGARLEACVVKVYDRSINKKDNLRLCHIKKQGDCDIYVLYIRGKQLAPGVEPTVADQVAHGGTDSDHSSEAAIAELIFRDVVADKIEKRKAEYAVAMRRITQQGFGAKLSSPEFQKLVTEELEKMRRAADARPFIVEPHHGIALNPDQHTSDDESPRTPASRTPASQTFATPGSAALVNSDDSSSAHSSSSESSSSSEDSSDSDSDNRPSPARGLSPFTSPRHVHFEDVADASPSLTPVKERRVNCGMGTSSSCAHLPPSLSVQQHVHSIYKMEADGEYVCGVCGNRGAGGMVYGCPEAECAGWCSHLRCVLTDPRDYDLRSVLPASAVTSYPALQDSDMFDLRAVLIMDGCNGQVRAAKDLLQGIFWPKGIDILKGSAQCSPSQNPLDCMRSFMQIKKGKPTWTWSSATCVSDHMKEFLKDGGDFKSTMKNCSKTDVNSFILSLMHLEQSLSSCFTLKTMQSGWAKAGLIGLELHQIMSHWIGWKYLSAQQVQGACVALCVRISM
jgi:hypothetical protein